MKISASFFHRTDVRNKRFDIDIGQLPSEQMYFRGIEPASP
jgi:hypothetical protein